MQFALFLLDFLERIIYFIFNMEKRKSIRVEFKVEAEITYNKITIKGEIDDLSVNGMLIITPEKIDLNSIVDVTVYLSGSSTHLSINLTGITTRIDERGIAIKFTEMEVDSFVHLRNIVAYNDTEIDEFLEFL